MADIPEYKQRTKIEPVPVSDASGALSQASRAWDTIGQMGAQVAQNQANELARISGTERGRTNPGQEPFPVINEATANYAKAYKAQEYSVALNKGTQMLDRLTFDVLRDPNVNTLNIYDDEYKHYLDDLTGQLTSENAGAVREQLQASYLSGRYKIESQIVDKAQGAEKESFKETYTTFSRNIINQLADGRRDLADAEYIAAEEYIDDPYNVPDLSLPARNALKKSLKDIYEDSIVSNDIRKRLRKKEPVEKIIESYANLPATVENLRKLEVAFDTFRSYAAATSAHDNLLISKATTQMIQQGGLSTAQMVLLKDQVLPGNFAQFETQHARFMEGQEEKTNSADFMDAYANNSAMLATLSGDKLNKGYQVHLNREAARLGRPLNIQEEAQVAQRFDTSIPAFNAKLSGGINSKNAGMARDYSSLYAALARNNPNVVSGVDNTTALKAEVFNDALANASNPEDAWKQANDGFSHLTPREVVDSKAAFQEKWKQTFGTGADTQFKNVLKNLGYSNRAMKNNPPAGLAIDFENLAQANYVQSRDWDKSIEHAQQKIAQRYMETTHNGFDQIQLLPPTKFLPVDDIRRLEIDYLQKLTFAQKAMMNDPEILAPFNYELEEGFSLSGVGVTVIAPGIASEHANPYRGVRRGINYKGEKIEEKGQFIFMSDQFTEFLQPGQPLPSWSLMFLPDNKLSPDLVYAPLTNEQGQFVGTQNARFMIPPEEIAAKNAVDKDLMKQTEMMANIRRKMASMIGGTYEY